MSSTLQSDAQRTAGLASVTARAAKAGAAAAVAGAALAFYAAYGDPHAGTSQKASVPFLVGLVVVVSAIVFGLLAPRALRAAQDGRPGASRWGLACGIVALIAMPVVFWTGVPLVVGAAGLVLGVSGRRSGGGRGATAAVVIGTLAIVGGIIFAVLGNLVLSH
jgi:hypothetical protein